MRPPAHPEGFAPEHRNLAATLCNMAAVPGCVLALLLADRLGRLKLLVSSAAGQAAAALALAFFFLVKTRCTSSLPPAAPP